MAEPLKNLLNEAYFERLVSVFQAVYPAFDKAEFWRLLFDEQWEHRELKQRIRHVTHTLRRLLPADYPEALGLLKQAAPHCSGLEAILFPDFVEVYGLDHWDASMEALELMTQYSTAEFAVRPFIAKDPERMMAQMLKWAGSGSEHVRRLASEGCRPRLPWAMALEPLKRDPSPILPILEALKRDESLYVRKSVANNLNDISKDHPELVKSLAVRWHGEHPHTDWILKHASRGLLRKGDPDMLALFGFESMDGIEVEGLEAGAQRLRIGDSLEFSFELVNRGTEPLKLRVEYGIDFVKANGRTSRKLFKITENTYRPGERVRFARRHAFADLTTRRHYPGTHRIAVVINGAELASAELVLLPAETSPL
ncbi:DNA alkylation repair protein [Paenibacillus hamazuiensis]|uniref:DNA alkylation repair protein n=1 Tax=Paenibacillus hamazuiensis TaxID=2936508 RepID=UPI00200BB476|nr:DNA alkylation repair protein [Paenibacillus hamazuiensis]